MSLSAHDRSRYARQLLLPQLGERGQARVLASSVRAPKDADGGALAVARTYAERAGLRVVSDGEFPLISVPTTEQVGRVAGEEALMEAARALVGAIAAVEALRGAAGFGGTVQSEIPCLSVLTEEA